MELHPRKNLMEELERLARAAAAGDFSAALDIDGLPPAEQEAARLVDRILRRHTAATQYDLMRHKLAGEALGIALWDMEVADGYSANPSHKFVWSQELRHMLGFSGEHDFPNTLASWADRLHPDDEARVVGAFRAHVDDHTGKTPYASQYRMMTKSGEYRHFHTRGATLRDAAGRPLRVAGAVRDITDSVRQQEMLESMLHAMDSYIYITDLETDEILFANRKMQTDFGIAGDGKGNICWKLMQVGQTGRCAWCKKGELLKHPGRAITWEQDNLVVGASLYNIDRIIEWPGGRKVHLQQCINITERKQAQEALLHREKMLETLNRAAIAFLSRKEEEREDTMAEGLGLIADVANFTRVAVFRNTETPDGLRVSQIYRWEKEGGPAEPLETLQNIPYATFTPRWQEILAAGGYINGPVRPMPEAEALRPFGCVSVLVLPVFNGGTFWGFVLFDDTREERRFTEREADMLRSAGFMLANMVIRDEKAAKIRAADEYAQLMLDAMPIGCSLWDSDLNCIGCNNAIVELFGLKDKQDFKDHFLERSFPEYQSDGRLSRERNPEEMRKALKNGRHVIDEYLHMTPDGTVVPAELTLVRVRYGNEYVLAVYVRDLREHKRMMHEIEQQHRLLRAVNTVSAAMLQSDAGSFHAALLRSMSTLAEAIEADRVYVWKNHLRDGRLYTSQLCEWSEGAEPQQGKEFLKEVLYGDTVPEWERTLSRGRCINAVIRELPADEQVMLKPQGILSILVVPIFLKGVFWGFIGFDDCHRERTFPEHAEALLRSVSDLIAEALIRNDMEENLRITADQLQRALTEAQGASRAKSEFLSRMSHEMRTPLNAVIGMATIGRNAASAERKDYALQKIHEASMHLLGIVNDVLEIAKIEAGKLELADARFAFRDMLHNAVSFVQYGMENKQQRFSLEIAAAVPSFVVGDEQRLKQVIINLLSNAVKFTPENGAIHMAVFLLEETDAYYALRIEVADSGIGIPPDQQKKIFLAFEQADGGINRRFGGTGLGLAISRRIVEQMGGTIWVTSQAGKGSRFLFTVPLGRADQTPPPPAACSTDDNAAGITEKEFAGKRLLVVEDMAINREILTALLDGTGCLIDVAENGREALEMVTKAPDLYDLVFMDVQMPEMDGLEATRRIRALPADRDGRLPIIAMTANVYQENIETCLAAGMDGHIGKPIDAGVLLATLRRYLSPQERV